jgi:hypothetical protein
MTKGWKTYRCAGPISALLLVVALLWVSCGGGGPTTPDGNGDGNGNVPVTPRFVVSLHTVCSEDVAVYGNVLYIADGPAGLKVVDISNKSSPSILKSIPTSNALRVYIYQQYLYLADSDAGFKVYSLAAPANPLQVYAEDTQWATSAAFHDGYLYLGDYYGGFRIYSLANPASPAHVRTLLATRVRDLAFNGDTLLISDPHYGLAVYRLQDAVTPVWIFSDSSHTANYEDIIGCNGFAILARSDEASRINLFTVADLAKIGLASSIYPARFIESMTASDDSLLVSCGEDGLKCFDLKGLPTLKKLWEIDTPGYARRAKVSGDFLYVADMSSVRVFDLSKEGGAS